MSKGLVELLWSIATRNGSDVESSNSTHSMTVEFYFSLSNILPSLFERRYYRPTKQAYQQAWAPLGLCCTTCAEHCSASKQKKMKMIWVA